MEIWWREKKRKRRESRATENEKRGGLTRASHAVAFVVVFLSSSSCFALIGSLNVCQVGGVGGVFE